MKPLEQKRGSSASIILLIFIAVTLGVVIYLLLQPSEADSSTRTMLFSVIGVTVVILILYLTWEFSAANRLRKLLKKISAVVDVDSTEETKKMYLQIYNTYMRLSEKKKQNFYAKVNLLRETLEEHMQNEKELMRLLQESDKGSITEQKKKYIKIFSIYEKLPRKVQPQYYPQVVQLRDRLERGK